MEWSKMTKISIPEEFGRRQCPNCGGSDFTESAPNQYRCVYCGSVLTLPETKSVLLRCPYCGTENEDGARYCSKCGKSLVSPMPTERKKLDPALVSMLVTVFGSMMIPLIGPGVGLFLAYRARRQARTSGDSRSERLARTAIILGWAFMALSMLPLCLALTSSSVQAGYTFCKGMYEALSDALSSQ